MLLSNLHRHYAPQIARMDQSENPFGFRFNRYPELESEQNALAAYSSFVNRDNVGPDHVQPENLTFVRGAADGIDLVLRTLVARLKVALTLTNPTFFPVPLWASLYGIRTEQVELLHKDLNDITDVTRQAEPMSAVMLVNPGNPTGTYIDKMEILNFAAHRHGLVIVDEAYVDFRPEVSVAKYINELPNLVVLRSLSKAWGMAGLRAGFIIANRNIIGDIKTYQPPFMLDTATADYLNSTLPLGYSRFCQMRQAIIEQREWFIESILRRCDCHIFPSATNFVSIHAPNAEGIVGEIAAQNIAVKAVEIAGMPYVKASIGLPSENQMLCDALIKWLVLK